MQRAGHHSRAGIFEPGHADGKASAPGPAIRPLVTERARHQLQSWQYGTWSCRGQAEGRASAPGLAIRPLVMQTAKKQTDG